MNFKDKKIKIIEPKEKNIIKLPITQLIKKKDNIIIQHAENDGEYLIPKTKYKADGFCK